VLIWLSYDAQVRKTMKAVKHVLTERFYLWEDARALADNDPEIDLHSTGAPYTPSDYLEAAEAVAEGETEALATEGGQHQSHESVKGLEQSGAEKVDPSTLPSKPSESQQPKA
jgi:large subunit ribosomal protein L47